MARRIDVKRARELLEKEFAEAEDRYSRSTAPPVSARAQQAAEVLFTTTVQSYREALLGCAVARVVDPETDIRSPYANQGPRAFSGRTLDERVVNPFLVSHDVPCSRGPYLASFRRSVRFVDQTAVGLRDRDAYGALLAYLDELEQADPATALELLRHLLYRFVELREQANVPIAAPQRMSLGQYEQLIDQLVSQPSGGLFPVLLVVALLKAVAQVYHLDWEVRWQGINVADQAKGTGGDVTVLQRGEVRVVLEVTEREVDRTRVQATFRSKILPSGIRDYLFVFAGTEPASEARVLAGQLFAQGHDIGFVPVREWIVHNLAMGGGEARERFLATLLELLHEAPARVRTRWNEQVGRLFGVQE